MPRLFIALLFTLHCCSLPTHCQETDEERDVYTNVWAVEVKTHADPNAVAARHGFDNRGEIIPGSNVYEFVHPGVAVTGNDVDVGMNVEIAEDEDVVGADQQRLELYESKGIIVRKNERSKRMVLTTSENGEEEMFNDPL